jgi:hypothetical protein
MRRNRLASWVTSVLSCAAFAAVIASVGDASADDSTRVSKCVKYQQTQKETAIEVRLTSSCSIDLACSVTWKLACEGKEPTHEAKAFPLLAGDVGQVTASAARCGDAGWAIRGVRWSCKASD